VAARDLPEQLPVALALDARGPQVRRPVRAAQIVAVAVRAALLVDLAAARDQLRPALERVLPPRRGPGSDPARVGLPARGDEGERHEEQEGGYRSEEQT